MTSRKADFLETALPLSWVNRAYSPDFIASITPARASVLLPGHLIGFGTEDFEGREKQMAFYVICDTVLTTAGTPSNP